MNLSLLNQSGNYSGNLVTSSGPQLWQVNVYENISLDGHSGAFGCFVDFSDELGPQRQCILSGILVNVGNRNNGTDVARLVSGSQLIFTSEILNPALGSGANYNLFATATKLT